MLTRYGMDSASRQWEFSGPALPPTQPYGLPVVGLHSLSRSGEPSPFLHCWSVVLTLSVKYVVPVLPPSVAFTAYRPVIPSSWYVVVNPPAPSALTSQVSTWSSG